MSKQVARIDEGFHKIGEAIAGGSDQDPQPSDKRVAAAMKRRPLFFDIETAIHPRIREWISPEELDLEGIKAPKNYKDPEKIAIFIENEKVNLVTKNLIAYQDKIAKAPLDADLGKVRAIGFREGVEGKICVMYVPVDFDNPEYVDPGMRFGFGGAYEVLPMLFACEKEIIEEFWNIFAVAQRETVGYNSIGFDFPYLLRRSMDLGIRPTAKVDLRRYQYRGNIDLMSILYNWGRAKGMKFVCERYGIINPNPELDGSMVADMDDATLVQYAAGDIFMLTGLYQLMKPVYL